MTSSNISASYYHHGRFRVKGGMLPDAVTAFRTYGDPKNPCIVLPSFYSAKLNDMLYLVGEGKALDTRKYFVVTFALFSNGESSSPSNTPLPYNGPYFPVISYEDNVRAQYTVLTKHLGITKVHAVSGFSMGGQQAYYWAIMYPDFLERYIIICSSARTSVHNQCILEGLKATMTASKDFEGGYYKSAPHHGIRAFARVCSAWSLSLTWFRENRHLSGGMYADLNTFLHEGWEGKYLREWDANDMLTLMNTWQTGDVTTIHGDRDLQTALGRIRAKGLIMPCRTDLYFPPEDSKTEVSFLGDKTELVVIDSIWGHLAGGGASGEDMAFMENHIKQFLAG
ncbi:hypothetical protein APHAL10511_005736 [Amanita phalloides]|nr:hypothetical protein APHAL10511_005736 [Amanita phalloides]